MKNTANKKIKMVFEEKSKDVIMRMPLMFPVEFKEGQVPTEIHVIPVGEWDHDIYGKIKITPDDIAQFVENFKKGIRKGVPITEGHEVDDEKPAIGWFKELIDKGDKGLWAKVEWTSRGKALLKEKSYKYFSPEFYRVYEDPETHQIYTNVLVGGALTNKPFFKGLKAIVFNEPNFITNKLKDNLMNLSEILKKEVKDLNEEEKKFLRSQMSEGKLTVKDIKKFAEALSDEPGEKEDGDEGNESNEGGENKESKESEENKEGEEGGDGDEGKEGESEGGDEGVEKISAAELKILREKADKGVQAFAELTKARIEREVDKMIFREGNKEGRLLPKSKNQVVNFMLGLDKKQRAEFSEIMKGLPSGELFSEFGDNGEEDGSVKSIVEGKINEILKANDGMKYSDAARQVFTENPKLAEQYEKETNV